MGPYREDQIGIRIPHKPSKIRRRHDRVWRRASVPFTIVVLFVGLFATIFAFQYLSYDADLEGRFDGESRRGFVRNEIGVLLPHYNRSVHYRELRFGRGSVRGGRDSRYWDRDDRRRDGEYEEDAVDLLGNDEEKDESSLLSRNSSVGFQGVGGLYNEEGRDELHEYEKKYKESLDNPDQSGERVDADGTGDANSSDEYDDGIDIDDAFGDGVEDAGSSKEKYRSLGEHNLKAGLSIISSKPANTTKSKHGLTEVVENLLERTSGSEKKTSTKRKTKHHSGSCEMKLLDSTSQLLEPLQTKKFSRFSLQYTKSEERPTGIDVWQPRFAGHQTLQEREDSFYARDQKVNCGFVKGPKGSPSTGFDLAEDDVKFMSSCHIAVSSCIFGNSDNLRTPYTRTITRSSRKNVCFVMFVDETTLQTLSSEGHQPDATGFIGLWKIVVVKNLPYDDMRRAGKIPKFLTHRLFPSARYSIWLDSKLRLQRDPILLLEYFLWRKGHEYAISNHYDRHCVWEEVLQNKKLNKFNHTVIDEQFQFYQADGLKKFDPSDPNKLLPSYVPEGSFIMRAHTPMSNLFSCLWFNEVDRFTPRDQLSFAYTYLKLRRMNPEKAFHLNMFHLNMFKDCERRSIAKLFRHRSEDQRTTSQQSTE